MVATTDPTYGPFWTIQVPDNSVQVAPFESMVTLDLWDQAVSDSFQEFAPKNVPATITLHVRWLPGSKALNFSDPSLGYAGIYLPSTAQLDWSGSGPTSATDSTPFTFHSDREGQQTEAAGIGHEVDGSLGQG